MPFKDWIDFIALCIAAFWPIMGIFILIRRGANKSFLPLLIHNNTTDHIVSILISIFSGMLTCCILAIILLLVVGG